MTGWKCQRCGRGNAEIFRACQECWGVRSYADKDTAVDPSRAEPIDATKEAERWATELEDDADAFTRRRLALQRLASATSRDVDVARLAGKAEAYGHAAEIIRATIARLRATP